LLNQSLTLGGCKTGRAKIIKRYNLKAKFVILNVGPVWSDGANGEPKLLVSCYRNSLQIAIENQIQTIAFPSIS
jgi:Predicted phosphatase homologous to the C-terminal domain of histone macroH2A1